MAHPQIAAFARLAKGSAKPTRSIAGQNTLITRTIHAMEYDPVHDEIVVPQLHAQAILTFRGGANGDEPPIRIIHGPDTQLVDPERLAVDPVHNEIFVPMHERIAVYPRDAQGNTAPIRVLEGPDTLLGAASVAVDPVHDLLIVGGFTTGEAGTIASRKYRLLIFNRTDTGNVKPRSIIAGPKTKLGYTALLAVYPPRELFLLAVSSFPTRSSPENFVGVWSEHDNGDVAPRWTIGGPNGMLREVRGVAIDPKNKAVIISDKYVNAVLTYYFPEIF